jgi:hypothetical protein
VGELDRFDGVERLQLRTRCDVESCVDKVENATSIVAYAGAGSGHSCDLENNAREDAGTRERGSGWIDCRRAHSTT